MMSFKKYANVSPNRMYAKYMQIRNVPTIINALNANCAAKSVISSHTLPGIFKYLFIVFS